MFADGAMKFVGSSCVGVCKGGARGGSVRTATNLSDKMFPAFTFFHSAHTSLEA